MSSTKRRRAIDAAVRRLAQLDWRRMPDADVAAEIVDVVLASPTGTVLTRMVSVLATATGQDPALNQGRLRKFASDLLQGGYLPEDVFANYISQDSPWRRDWRSRKGTQPPSERDIRATIAQFNSKAASQNEIEL